MGHQLFFELIQVAIGNRESLSKTPTLEEWMSLYSMASKQALAGVCAAALERLKAHGQRPPEPLLWKWIGTVAEIQQRNERLNKQCVKLQKILLRDGFRSSVLKGQGVALYYPDGLSSYRQPGDIDIWVDAPRDVVIDYAMKLCPNRVFDAKHIHCNVFRDTEIEMHWVPSVSPVPSINKKLEKFYNEQRERQMTHNLELCRDGAQLVTPDVRFNAVYLLNHMLGHFLYEGIGLRQMMDYYFILLKLGNGQRSVLQAWKEFGLDKFAASVMYVMQIVFGMSEDEVLCKPDSKGGRVVLQEIMEGGNFGFYSQENQVRGESWWHHAKRRFTRRLRLIQYDPKGLLWQPIYRVRLGLWRRRVLNKYGL